MSNPTGHEFLKSLSKRRKGPSHPFFRYAVPLRRQDPCFPEVGFDPYVLLAKVCSDLFPHREPPDLLFFERTSLASIKTAEKRIEIHQILNCPQLPEWVLQHILIHEMIHLDVPGRDVEGKYTSHPPEFWEEEQRLSPRSNEAMSWVFTHIGSFLQPSKKHERIFVKSIARKRPLLCDEDVIAWLEREQRRSRLR